MIVTIPCNPVSRAEVFIRATFQTTCRSLTGNGASPQGGGSHVSGLGSSLDFGSLGTCMNHDMTKRSHCIQLPIVLYYCISTQCSATIAYCTVSSATIALESL